MKSVEQVAGAMGEADADTEAEPRVGPPAAAATAATDGAEPEGAGTPSSEQPAPAADPWAAVLEAGAALLQGMAAARTTGAAPIAIERDPATGQASLRLPMPDPAVLKRLAQAFEPWLR